MVVNDDPFADEGFVERFSDRRCEHDSVNSCIDEPAILERVRLFAPDTILEVGCATGMLTKQMALHTSGLVAIDRSALMIRKAQAEVQEPNVSFVHCEFDRFATDRKFEMVVAGMTVHLIEDLASFITKAHGVLEIGGRLVFSQRHPVRTCNPNGASNVGEEPNWRTARYFDRGIRNYEWLNRPVTCFHRSIEEIVATVVKSGLQIVEIAEPQPITTDHSDRVQENLSSPSVLLIHAVKAEAQG